MTGKDLDRAIIHLDRKVNGQLALAVAHHTAQIVFEIEEIRRDVELLDGDGEQIVLSSDLCPYSRINAMRVGTDDHHLDLSWLRLSIETRSK